MDYLQYEKIDGKEFKANTKVLNLIINGLPSILKLHHNTHRLYTSVLNLIINGLPSILVLRVYGSVHLLLCFKPYYKWITFNT